MKNKLSTESSAALPENTAESVIPAAEITENVPTETQTLTETDNAALPGNDSGRKKKKRLLIVISSAAAILIAAVVVTVVLLAGRHDPDKLIGEWLGFMVDGNKAEYIIFYKNGTGAFVNDSPDDEFNWLDEIPFNWHTDKKILTLDINFLLMTRSIDFEFETKNGAVYLTAIDANGEARELIILRKEEDFIEADDLLIDVVDDQTQETTEESVSEEIVDYSDSVEVVNRIWFHRPYYNAWIHLVIVKNKSDKALSVSTSSLAYDEEKNLLGSANGDAVIVPPGYTSYVEETFYIDEDVDDFKTVVKAVAADPDESVLQDVECKADKTLTGVVLTISNEGESEIDSVEGYVAFYLDGDLVDVAPMSVDSLGVGESKFDQVDCDEEEFDSVKYYLTASR